MGLTACTNIEETTGVTHGCLCVCLMCIYSLDTVSMTTGTQVDILNQLTTSCSQLAAALLQTTVLPSPSHGTSLAGLELVVEAYPCYCLCISTCVSSGVQAWQLTAGVPYTAANAFNCECHDIAEGLPTVRLLCAL